MSSAWQASVRTVGFSQSVKPGDVPKVRLVVLLCLLAAVMEGSERSLFRLMLERTEANPVIVGLVTGTFLLGGGLFWGILASQAVLTRKQILIMATVVQGLVAIIEPLISHRMYWSHIALHCLVKFCLAPARPISRSIVADVFPSLSAGMIYGLMVAGNVIGEVVTREFHEGEDTWDIAFIIQGSSSLLLGLVLVAFLLVPPVVPSCRTTCGEFKKLGHFLRMPTFFILVGQGCFGGIPWLIMEYQVEFFSCVGFDGGAPMVHLAGKLAGALGSIFGGQIGDRLAQRSLLHGRIIAAQISVFSGIPLAYLLYVFDPFRNNLPWALYYLAMVIVFGLMTSWAYSATNPQMISSISYPDERTLAFTSHWAMEQGVASLAAVGLIRFRFDDIAKEGYQALGSAMFLTTALPWLVCGLLYSSLHLTYPRDVERTLMQTTGRFDSTPHSVSETSIAASTFDGVVALELWAQNGPTRSMGSMLRSFESQGATRV